MAWTWITVIATLACLRMAQAACSDELETLITVKIEEGRENGSIHNFRYDVRMLPNKGDKVKDLFYIDNRTLYLKQDMIVDGSQHKTRCQYVTSGIDFDIECSDTNSSPKAVIVEVDLKDDYPPTFSESTYTVYIPEENPEAVGVFELKGTNVNDEDCGANSFQYKIESPHDTGEDEFGIRRVQPKVTEIFANFTLDYERQSVYNLIISVTSQRTINNAGKKAFTNLTIEVVDIDDRDPIFDTPSFQLYVDEKMNMSNGWLQSTPPIHAADGDTGIDQSVVYSIAKIDPDLDIEINSTDGRIKINSVLDREINAIPYQIIIKAAQSDNDYKSAKAVLTIHVKDVNDHLPQFSQLDYNVSLQRNSPDGTWIVALPVSDGDVGDNAKNNLSITSDDSSVFGLDQPINDGIMWLVVNSSDALRRITTARVTIRATPTTDLAADVTPCDYTTTCVTHVNVNLLDTTGQAPRFDRDTYSFQVYQSKVGLSVGNISVVNQTPVNDTPVIFSISQLQNAACDGFFGIDESGEIIMIKDLFQSQLCLFQMKACFMEDNTSNGMCSTVTVAIAVLTMKTRYDLNLDENGPVGFQLLRLPERKLKLTSDAFEVKSNYLVTKDTLDRERKSEYTLRLTDDNGHLVSTIHIRIRDINDNAPIPEKLVYNELLTGLEKEGAELLTIKATDADEGSNGDVSFSLLNGHDWLSIGKKSGTVTLKKISSHGNSGRIKEVFVQIQDQGIPPETTLVTLQVFFTKDDNKTTPLVLTITREKVIKDLTKIEDQLTSIIGQTVTIVRVDQLADVNEVGSILHLTARDGNGKGLPPGDLKRLLTQHAQEIFDKLHEDGDTGESSHLYKTLFIVFVSLFVVALLVVILTCRYYRTRSRQNRQKMSIMATLNKDTRIYDDTGKDDNITKNGGSSVGRSNGISSNGPNASSLDFDNLAFVHDDYENIESSSDVYAKITRNGSIRNNDQNARTPVAINISSVTSDSNVDDNWALEPSTSGQMQENPEIVSNDNEQSNSTTQKPYISTIKIERPQNRSSDETYKNISVSGHSNDENKSNVTQNNSQDGDTRIDFDDNSDERDNQYQALSTKTPSEHKPGLPLPVRGSDKMPTEPHQDYSDSTEMKESHPDGVTMATAGVKDNDSTTDPNGLHPNVFSFLDSEATFL